MVAVIRLPSIANFTDFAPLEKDAGVRLRYVQPGQPIGSVDAVIIPGGFTTNNRLRAGAGGLVHHRRRPGDPITAGDIVAEIRTPAGAVVEEVRSPVSGFVLSYPRFRNQAVMTGDHVAFIASGE